MAVTPSVSAHEIGRVHDCTTPGCPNEGTEKGPGGNLYCGYCRKQIYEKKVTTSIERHGFAGGGTLRKALTASERSTTDNDALARRLRTELKALERICQNGADYAQAHVAGQECAKTMRELLARVHALVDATRPE